jgi:hypothetical protein
MRVGLVVGPALIALVALLTLLHQGPITLARLLPPPDCSAIATTTATLNMTTITNLFDALRLHDENVDWSLSISGWLQKGGGKGEGSHRPAINASLSSEQCKEVVFVSCNWYDVPTKVGPVLHLLQGVRARLGTGEEGLAHPVPSAFLAGGLGRLSSQRAQILGGEAFELRDALLALDPTIAPREIAVVTGLRTTGDNVDALLTWLAATTQAQPIPLHIFVLQTTHTR